MPKKPKRHRHRVTVLGIEIKKHKHKPKRYKTVVFNWHCVDCGHFEQHITVCEIDTPIERVGLHSNRSSSEINSQIIE